MSSAAKAWAKAVAPSCCRRTGARIDFLRWVADHMNADGTAAYGRIGRIARDTGRSERAIQYAARFWEGLGALHVRPKPGRRCNQFILNLGWQPDRARSAPVICTLPSANLHPLPPNPGPNLHPEPKKDSNPRRGTQESAHARAPAVSPSAPVENLVGKEAPAEAAAAPIAPTETTAPPAPGAANLPDHAGPEPDASPRKPPPGRGRTRGGPLPDDWCPTAADRAYAASLGLDAAQMALEMDRHYRDTGAWRPDWSTVFRAWCRRELKFYPAGRPPTPKPSKADKIRAWQAEVASELIGGELRL